jgi:UDP-N-acetylglucosamine/UDP-N-acetylgalactosamine diphosphorylase
MGQESDLHQQLCDAGQSQLAEYLSKVTPASAQDTIKQQIDSVDLGELGSLIEKYIKQPEPASTSNSIEPAQYYRIDGSGPQGAWDRALYTSKGEDLIRASKVACFTVAGGQGSRLGYDGPKGCFPTSCVQEKPLFELFAEGILATQSKYSTLVPWYIMTSPLNHEATVDFFSSRDYFGLDKGQITFFEQGVMPSLDSKSGQILMSDPIHLATNPDGHGGAFKALHVSGALDDMKARGIEHVSYFQIDNPHSRVIDPTFIGLHAFAPDSSGEFSSKMVAKVSWDEKVGVFCDVDRRTEIIEYSDLSPELAKKLDDDGGLAFNAGSIAIHLIGVGFVEQVVSNPDYALPFHRAIKKVPHFDLSTGRAVEPVENNAVKLEKFVFDGIPLAKKSIVVETDRIEEFAPVKNATGNDSIESSKLIQSERAGRWLESVGVDVPRSSDGSVNATIEISALTALCREDLKGKDLPSAIEPGAMVVL